MIAGTHPILTCAAARELEAKLFGADEVKEWAAMQQAGAAIAEAVLRDFAEIGGFPPDGRILVLAGKGHNGGDALIASRQIIERFPSATVEVEFAFGQRALRPLAARAWRELLQTAPERVRGSAAALGRSAELPPSFAAADYDLCLDGVFGFQFRPPCDPRTAALLEQVNALPIPLRAAVDLPSAGIFRADFTYATGSVKAPIVDDLNAGRIRYLDLGFFSPVAGVVDPGPAILRVLTPAMLAPLAALRPARCDKRSYGHLFVLGGSRSYPGAVMMAVEAALRSGAGLVTAFVPETLAAAFAARLPEAIWVGWPETPDGSLALEGLHLLRERLSRADALVVGPGIGREAETLALVGEIVRLGDKPVLLDADALQPDIVRAAKSPLVVTPHAGEFARIAPNASLEDFVRTSRATVVLKGPVTRIGTTDGDAAVIYHSFAGGPVLARGGSGDLLAGMIGAQLAQSPTDPALAAARGVLWHGLAADRLARARGQVAVHTTQLLDHLGAMLRGL
ncbi:NAD(P)H-hydrate dehydratase [Opitutus terrae]|uniref:ADP-dependent (S)-NAD(P)H-hydrate dehydratase n=1 Tax=Opitutus terrae (strain DSM 11246 / JCM 15787 / PB90-1) TaxID=452637 RepID=B1ZNA3_OPITP|nr:NAD(P)H-hydrate dehydratase [Opitutus terrae]ACB73472.1 carbohydrate kinase, YjeF related protein [Opitutus terrae PB90-1]